MGTNRITREKTSHLLVELRHPTELDRAEFVSLKLASREFLEPWEVTPPGQRRESLYGNEGFDRYLATARLESSMRFVVCLRDSGVIIGNLGISNITRGGFQSCTLGYWIGAAHAGRGYMTQALILAVRFVFKELKLHRAEANIIPTNKASTRLVKRLGFRYEGLGKRYIRINGKWQDHARWAMTIEDYRELSKRPPFAPSHRPSPARRSTPKTLRSSR